MQRRPLAFGLATLVLAPLAACSKNDEAAPAAAAPARKLSGIEAYAIASKGSGFTMGPVMAANTVYVFFDTTCPHCAELWNASQPLLGKLKMVGPLLTFACGRFRAGFAHRGRRCPRGAHAVAVGAVRRLHCDARARVVPQNSLRDLRSLRSNSRGKSVHEARSRAPTLALRFSSPQKSPPAGSACREVHRWFVSSRMPPLVQQRHARAGVGAPLRCREAQGSWPRAQRASSSDSSTLSERSDRRERSEFGDGAARPSIAGESARSADRRGEAPQPARACLCRAHRNPHSRRRKTAKGRVTS
jgi:hypothetical protein